MVRGRDACWEHCVLVDATRQKVRCNYCHRQFSGGVYRMKFHLAQIKNKDIVPCPEVPDDVRDLMHGVINTPKKQKAQKMHKLEQTPTTPQNSSSASGGCHASTCPSMLLPRPSPNIQPSAEDEKRQRFEQADKKIALFFFHYSIPFSASQSVHYQSMIEAVAECGKGYKPPSYDGLRTTLLEGAKREMHESFQKLKNDWKEIGCTILCDSWSDGGSKSLVVFSVASAKGSRYLRSVDVSSRVEDVYYLFDLLESAVKEVGVDNVIQIITDNATSLASAAGLLLKKYPSLFWSPCASYCFERMLEDISKLEWISPALEEASTIAHYIYSNDWMLNMMRKFTGGRELIRPKLTTIASQFLRLQSIVLQEDNLKHMFSQTDWSSTVGRQPDAQSIRSLLYSERFWKAAREAVRVSEPILKLLRMVECSLPAIGYIYEGIKRAKSLIRLFYGGCEERYMSFWEIIERRWNIQPHSHLHAAAAFLNPSVFYNPIHKFDANMRNGFHSTMWKMFTEEKDRIELTKEQPLYLNAQGALGSEFATLGRTLNSPVLKGANGTGALFDKLYSGKKSKMEMEKLGDLVYVHCNLCLQAVDQSREGRFKPVVFDEIDVSSEWPIESETSSLVLDDSWLGGNFGISE
ncbi:hypothetical protein HPP92_007427 [Vanilla planifolia]|uniref:BED-type domain-containing protein n=1 Tax=Vanilla planifolia TaxID=51239 RepID=A0A835RG44_VANPL|nr:hypothetical protein HPP92_007427 [Vanilla planifolia]